MKKRKTGTVRPHRQVMNEILRADLDLAIDMLNDTLRDDKSEETPWGFGGWLTHLAGCRTLRVAWGSM